MHRLPGIRSFIDSCWGWRESMNKRINIPDRVVSKGARSRLTEWEANLRARLKEEALTNAERDLEIAAEWFPLEEGARRAFEASRKQNRHRDQQA
jgi:hypothetical protein